MERIGSSTGGGTYFVGLAAALAVAVVACSGKTELGGSPGGAAAEPAQAAAAGTASPAALPRRHLLVVVELEAAAHAARVVFARPVELPLPRRRGPERPEPWRVEVLGDAGAVLYAAPLADASELRAEFPDPQTGELRGVTTHKAATAVTLRLPELPNARQVRLVNVADGVELGRVAYPQVAP
jgi:hypothetical protein